MRHALAAAEVTAPNRPLGTEFLLRAALLDYEEHEPPRDFPLEALKLELSATILPLEEGVTGRWTLPARAVLEQARHWAQLEGNEYIGAEALLKGLRTAHGNGQTVLKRVALSPLRIDRAPKVDERLPRLAADPSSRQEDRDCVILPREDRLWPCVAAVTAATACLGLAYLSHSLLNMDSYELRLVMERCWVVALMLAVLVGVCFATFWQMKSKLHHTELICDRRSGRVWLRRTLLGLRFATPVAPLKELQNVATDGARTTLAFANQSIAVQTRDPEDLARRLQVPMKFRE